MQNCDGQFKSYKALPAVTGVMKVEMLNGDLPYVGEWSELRITLPTATPPPSLSRRARFFSRKVTVKKGISKGAVFSPFVFYSIILSCLALLNLIALSIWSPTYKKR